MAETDYLRRLEALKQRLEEMGSPARLDLEFQAGRPPTQAFSEFLTNKEQGDWAERTFIANFNAVATDLWAVKYGRSEDLVAGEPGFNAYYEAYQGELSTIGKRPDLLLFPRAEFQAAHGECIDISSFDHQSLDALVGKASMAIEVRSSSFLSLRYEDAARRTREELLTQIRQAARTLTDDYEEELQAFAPDWLASARQLQTTADLTDELPRALARRGTERLRQATELTGQIKQAVRQLASRDFLSITPKSEDLSLVYRWVRRYGVPHHYCQVFFDRAVLISFEKILSIIGDVKRENVDFFIEADEKNQRKVTFKINVRLGREVMTDIAMPEHRSAMKELPKGRLLFYVRFDPSRATFHPGGLSRA